MARDRMAPLDPPPELAEMQRHTSVGSISLYGGEEARVVLSYDACRRVLRSPAFSADFQSPGYPRVHPTLTHFAAGQLNHMDPPEHDIYRRMLAPEFMVKRIEQLRSAVSDMVDKLIDGMVAAGPGVDMINAMAISVPALVTCSLLGVPYGKRDFFVGCVDQFLGGKASPDEVAAGRADLRGLLREMIRAKRDNGDDDLLSRVVHDYVETGELKEEQLVGFAELLLAAGFDTTSNMIGLGTLALLEHPDQLAALRDDQTLIAGAIEELLRFLTVPHLGRHRAATEDFEIDGHVIRAGEGVVVALNIANRDPAQFSEPNTLDIRRENRTHLAFGFGVHACLGATLARLELEIVYTALINRMPNLALAVPIDQLEFKSDNAVYGLQHLPITW
ncbi:MAG TPA: cytochrome P450 [Mycobacterium sp.]